MSFDNNVHESIAAIYIEKAISPDPWRFAAPISFNWGLTFQNICFMFVRVVILHDEGLVYLAIYTNKIFDRPPICHAHNLCEEPRTLKIELSASQPQCFHKVPLVPLSFRETSALSTLIWIDLFVPRFSKKSDLNSCNPPYLNQKSHSFVILRVPRR